MKTSRLSTASLEREDKMSMTHTSYQAMQSILMMFPARPYLDVTLCAVEESNSRILI
jgi:hypothetical protein